MSDKYIDSKHIPYRRLASLGGNNLKQVITNGKTNTTLVWAVVTNVYYKRGTVDFRLANGTTLLQTQERFKGEQSAPIPVDFYGQTKDGQPFGHYRPIKRGNRILVAYVDNSLTKPVIVGVYPNNAQQYELVSPVIYDDNNADYGDEDSTLASYKRLPSQQIIYQSGLGNFARSLSGHSFLVCDQNLSSYLDDINTVYDNIGYFSNPNSGQAEPLFDKAGSWLLVHEDNPTSSDSDNHYTRFYVNKQGDLQIVFGTRNVNDLLVINGSKDKGFSIARNYDGRLTDSNNYVRFELGSNDGIKLVSATQGSSQVQSSSLEVSSKGVLVNGKDITTISSNNIDPDTIKQVVDSSVANATDDIKKDFSDSMHAVSQEINSSVNMLSQALADNVHITNQTKDAVLNAEKAGHEAQSAVEDMKNRIVYYTSISPEKDIYIPGKFLHLTETTLIDDGIIKNAMIANGTIGSAKIGNGAINTANIADGAITRAKIGNAQIVSANIADATITDAKIGKLSFNHMVGETLDASKINVINLNASNINAGTITADRIFVRNLGELSHDLGNITQGNIQAGQGGVDIKDLPADNPDEWTPSDKARLQQEITTLQFQVNASVAYGNSTGNDTTALTTALNNLVSKTAPLFTNPNDTTYMYHKDVDTLLSAVNNALTTFNHNCLNTLSNKIATTTDGKNSIYTGSQAPANPVNGDIWYAPTNDGSYTIKIYRSGTWQDTTLDSFRDMQAEIRNQPTTYYQDNQPSGNIANNSVWYKTNADGTSTVYVYQNGKWQPTLDKSISDLTQSLDTTKTSLNQSITATKNDLNQTINNTRDSLTNDINNISIGGRNLLLASQEHDNELWYVRWDNAHANNGTYLTSNIYITSSIWDGIHYRLDNLVMRNAINTTDDFTFSIYVKVDKGVTLDASNFYFFNADGVFNIEKNINFSVINESWIQISVTGKFTQLTPIHTNKFYVGFELSKDLTGGKMYLACPKLEKGSKPTDYSVAPEDVQQNITDSANTLQKGIDANTTALRTHNFITNATFLSDKIKNTASNGQKPFAWYAYDNASITVSNWGGHPAWVNISKSLMKDGKHPYITSEPVYVDVSTHDKLINFMVQVYLWGDPVQPKFYIDVADDSNFTQNVINVELPLNTDALEGWAKTVPLLNYKIDGSFTRWVRFRVIDPSAKLVNGFILSQPFLYITNHTIKEMPPFVADNVNDYYTTYNNGNSVYKDTNYHGVTISNTNGIQVRSGNNLISLNADKGIDIFGNGTENMYIDPQGNLTMRGNIIAGNISGINLNGDNLNLHGRLNVLGSIVSGDVNNNHGVIIDPNQGLVVRDGNISIGDDNGTHTTIKDDGTLLTNNAVINGKVTSHDVNITGGDINMNGGVFHVDNQGNVTAKSFTSLNGVFNQPTLHISSPDNTFNATLGNLGDHWGYSQESKRTDGTINIANGTHGRITANTGAITTDVPSDYRYVTGYELIGLDTINIKYSYKNVWDDSQAQYGYFDGGGSFHATPDTPIQQVMLTPIICGYSSTLLIKINNPNGVVSSGLQARVAVFDQNDNFLKAINIDTLNGSTTQIIKIDLPLFTGSMWTPNNYLKVKLGTLCGKDVNSSRDNSITTEMYIADGDGGNITFYDYNKHILASYGMMILPIIENENSTPSYQQNFIAPAHATTTAISLCYRSALADITIVDKSKADVTTTMDVQGIKQQTSDSYTLINGGSLITNRGMFVGTNDITGSSYTYLNNSSLMIDGIFNGSFKSVAGDAGKNAEWRINLNWRGLTLNNAYSTDGETLGGIWNTCAVTNSACNAISAVILPQQTLQGSNIHGGNLDPNTENNLWYKSYGGDEFNIKYATAYHSDRHVGDPFDYATTYVYNASNFVRRKGHHFNDDPIYIHTGSGFRFTTCGIDYDDTSGNSDVGWLNTNGKNMQMGSWHGGIELNSYGGYLAVNSDIYVGNSGNPKWVYAGNFQKYSSKSIKKNIKPLDSSLFSQLLSAKLFSYQYNRDNATTKYNYGLVIDDDPNSINYYAPTAFISSRKRDNGKVEKSVMLDNLITGAVSGVQENNSLISKLLARITYDEVRLTRLEKALQNKQ